MQEFLAKIEIVGISKQKTEEDANIIQEIEINPNSEQIKSIYIV